MSHKIHTTVPPVFVSQKIEHDLKMREANPPLVKQQCLVYKFECSDLCDAGYICRLHISPLNTKAEVHPSASTFVLNILQHLLKEFSNNFSILKKCKSKFDCLVFEMFFTNKLRPLVLIYNQTHFLLMFLNSS